MIAAAAAGALSSLLFGFMALTLGANQVASGLALVIFGTGMSSLIGTAYVGIAIQSFDSEFIPRDALLGRLDEMHAVLRELNARGLRADRTSSEIFDRAWRMLSMRRVLARTRDGYLVLPRGRPLVSYYANSIAHLLGPFMTAVQARDAVPAMIGLQTLPPLPSANR